MDRPSGTCIYCLAVPPGPVLSVTTQRQRYSTGIMDKNNHPRVLITGCVHVINFNLKNFRKLQTESNLCCGKITKLYTNFILAAMIPFSPELRWADYHCFSLNLLKLNDESNEKKTHYEFLYCNSFQILESGTNI